MSVTSSRPVRSETEPGRAGRGGSRFASPAASYHLLVFASAILIVVGLAAVLSSSSIDSARDDGDPYALFKAQLAYLAIGVAFLALASRLRPSTIRAIGPWLLIVSFVTLVLVAVSPWGRESGGNRNWLDFGEFSAQPSEAAKLALALYLGIVLAYGRERLVTLKGVMVPAGFVSLVVIGLVIAGRDAGTATVMVLLVAAAFWTAGVPVRFLVVGCLLSFGGLVLAVATRPSLLKRLSSWWSPTACDPLDGCFQTTHGTWALASGGLWGLGPGLSRQKWSLLPEASNDFVYAIVGEEFGLIGTVLVIVAFAMIAIAVGRIVRRHRDLFVQIAASAIGAWIVGQACLNIAVVVGFAPVTGVPLPLVSSGGSSLITSLAGIGILLAFARSEPGAREALLARGRRASVGEGR
jgi:cell division protein FtsW